MNLPPTHPGRLSVSTNTLQGGDGAITISLESGSGALGLVEISITPTALMKALMSFGAQPCVFKMWPNVAFYPNQELMVGTCKHLLGNAQAAPASGEGVNPDAH